MAARLRFKHQDEVREKIRASQLVNRLENHAFGEVEMTNTQVTAALGLLKKCVPDLQAVELSGNPDAPVLVSDAGIIGKLLPEVAAGRAPTAADGADQA